MIEYELDDAEHRPIRRMLTAADLLSLANGVLGLLTIIAAFAGRFEIAFAFILLAILMDGLDGAASRLGYGGGPLGATLDSYADLVSFVVAPLFLAWNAWANVAWVPAPPGVPAAVASNALLLGVLILYFSTGILRLARFDYLHGGTRHDYFIGLTTPGAAGVVASVVLLDWPPTARLGLILFVALLMTSRLRLPKLRGPLAPASALVLLAAVASGNAYGGLGPILVLSFFVAYLLLGPGYVRRHEDSTDAQPA